MALTSWNQRQQGVIHMFLNRRKARLFIISCCLVAVFITIQQQNGLSLTELQTQVHTFSISWNRLGPSSSTADLEWDDLKEPSALINDTEIHGEETTEVYKGDAIKAHANAVQVHDGETPELYGEEAASTSEKLTPLIAWIKSSGISSERIPLISIADSKYIQALRSLKARLDRWGRGSDFIVICLDTACTEENSFKGYGGYIHKDGKVMDSVALIKFQINLELSKNGYNFVFLDGDVYLTGSRDPFEDMLPLSNDTWDIQFQYDQANSPIAAVNIGWYFSKSTPATIEFYERSNKSWTENRRWDQSVMNEVLAVMEREEHSLKVHRLWNPRYQNWMLNDWQSSLFGDEYAMAAFVQDASVIHFTCVEQALKTYFGSNFGGFADVDGYYSNPPPLLAVANISGLPQSIHAQISFAAQLANVTGRTLIWPDTVGIVQKRSETKYEYLLKFPSVRTVSYASAQQAGVKTVEGRYLSNRQSQTNADPLHEVLLNATGFILDGGPAALEREILGLDPRDVVVIDLSNFAPSQWLKEFVQHESNPNRNPELLANQSSNAEKAFQQTYANTGMKEYSAPIVEKLAQCRNVNDRWPGCVRICK